VKSSCKGLERADGVIAGGLAMPGAAVVGLDYFSGLLATEQPPAIMENTSEPIAQVCMPQNSPADH